MHILMIISTVFSLLLLGAHHLRFGETGLAVSFVLLTGLLFSRRTWGRGVIVAALIWGTWTWVDSTISFVRMRMLMEADWGRLAMIMASVVLIGFIALLFLIFSSGRQWFRQNDGNDHWRSASFLLTCIGLLLARAKVSFPILLLDRYAPGWGGLEVLLLGFYAQWITGWMLKPNAQPSIRRRIWLGFSAVFFLQLFFGLLGMDRMLMTGTLHLPVPALIVGGPVYRGGGFFMPILFGVTLLLVGPAWCSHLCYIGAWDDASSRIRHIRPRPLRSTTMVLSRLGVLVLVIGAAWGLRIAGAGWMTAAFAGIVFGLFGVIIMLTVSRRRGSMIHCTAYCPMGIIANVLGKISPWRIRIGSDCTGCKVCFARCRYGALDERALKKGQPGLSCTLCGDCVGGCRHEQLYYVFPGLRPDKARAVFLVLVVTFHAVFLGVARI